MTERPIHANAARRDDAGQSAKVMIAVLLSATALLVSTAGAQTANRAIVVFLTPGGGGEGLPSFGSLCPRLLRVAQALSTGSASTLRMAALHHSGVMRRSPLLPTAEEAGPCWGRRAQVLDWFIVQDEDALCWDARYLAGIAALTRAPGRRQNPKLPE